jgi:hypothetical protein
MRWGLIGVLAAIAVVAIGAYAIGAGKASKDLVLCAAKNDGDLSLASAKGKCAKGEKKLTVAKEGPIGPAGAKGDPGPRGAAGERGPSGDSGAEAVHYLKSASEGCKTEFEKFCNNPNVTRAWQNVPGFGAAGYYRDQGGTVHLVGAAERYVTSGGGSPAEPGEGIFYLPPGMRPSATEIFTVPGEIGLGSNVHLEVRSDGVVKPPGAIQSGAGVVSFAGVAFHP